MDTTSGSNKMVATVWVPKNQRNFVFVSIVVFAAVENVSVKFMEVKTDGLKNWRHKSFRIFSKVWKGSDDGVSKPGGFWKK